MTAFANQYGPWAMVTGASSGLGRAIARRLGERGLNVILHGRNIEALTAVAQDIQKAGGETRIITGDISDTTAINAVKAQVKGHDIGTLVAAAGFGTSGMFAQSRIDSELNMLEVNVRAYVLLTHYFAQQMVAKKRGGIMLFGSLVGFQGTPYAANYAATKAYMQVLAEGCCQTNANHSLQG